MPDLVEALASDESVYVKIPVTEALARLGHPIKGVMFLANTLDPASYPNDYAIRLRAQARRDHALVLSLLGRTPDALEVAGRELVISGERPLRETGGRLYQQVEIEVGPFRRVVELGADVVADSAKASYDDGVLRVELPLAGQVTRRVPIEPKES